VCSFWDLPAAGQGRLRREADQADELRAWNEAGRPPVADEEIRMIEWGGATFEDADRANEFEAARAEEYWEARETAADREIDALASAALLMNRRLNGWRSPSEGTGVGDTDGRGRVRGAVG
jgi:hypothetical protein